MENEGEKYSRGASGFGAPDYASPAWRAGDMERQRLQRDKSNASGASSSSDSASGTSSSSDSLNVWAFIIVWIVLFYLTSQLITVLAEMIFGKEANAPAPEFMKWLVVIFVLTLPTVLVYVFRKIIPGLFYIVLIGGILAIIVVMIANA